ncbi:hypothetical protein RQN9TF_12660 [Rhodococcus qingshengii]|uniref:hypothetical protein n=1 Tax=Rhodococcus qingshengii TaxID=334542 RepID=UPI0021FE2D90|nr:hypothetical protein [Rhodococcus qingshengii]BDQ20056.1 hypothetical protein RQN9TF_12660 [Rhodococcus qingshengii]
MWDHRLSSVWKRGKFVRNRIATITVLLSAGALLMAGCSSNSTETTHQESGGSVDECATYSGENLSIEELQALAREKAGQEFDQLQVFGLPQTQSRGNAIETAIQSINPPASVVEAAPSGSFAAYTVWYCTDRKDLMREMLGSGVAQSSENYSDELLADLKSRPGYENADVQGWALEMKRISANCPVLSVAGGLATCGVVQMGGGSVEESASIPGVAGLGDAAMEETRGTVRILCPQYS